MGLVIAAGKGLVLGYSFLLSPCLFTLLAATPKTTPIIYCVSDYSWHSKSGGKAVGHGGRDDSGCWVADSDAESSGRVAGVSVGVGEAGVVNMPGRVMPLERLPPKNVWRIKFMMNQAEKTRIRPITAAII